MNFNFKMFNSRNQAPQLHKYRINSKVAPFYAISCQMEIKEL